MPWWGWFLSGAGVGSGVTMMVIGMFVLPKVRPFGDWDG